MFPNVSGSLDSAELFRHLRLNGYDRKRGTGCEITCTLSTRGEYIFNLQSLTLILFYIGNSLHFCWSLPPPSSLHEITATNLWCTMHTRRHAYIPIIHRYALSFSYVKREEDEIISLNYVRRQMLWMQFSKHEIRVLRERSLRVSVLSCGLPEVSECVTDRLCGSAYFCPSFKEPLSLSPAHLPTWCLFGLFCLHCFGLRKKVVIGCIIARSLRVFTYFNHPSDY